jgi:hypothetical protein
VYIELDAWFERGEMELGWVVHLAAASRWLLREIYDSPLIV